MIHCAARLMWFGRWHLAERNGRVFLLAEAPDLGAGPVAELDYIPCALHHIRRLPTDSPGYMDPAEVAAADALLRKFLPSGAVPLVD